MAEDSAGHSGGSGARPLRRDAERNRQRILAAAAEVFNERGLEVSLDEIARHAGVGVGTVYRRFRTKEELIEATRLSHAADPDIWRRYLTLILDGMRPGREGTTPLPVPAMLPEEMEKSMRQAAPSPR